VSLYHEEPPAPEVNMDHDLLRDYIAYAREHIHPVISEEVRFLPLLLRPYDRFCEKPCPASVAGSIPG
jgi:hypothetical protein